MGVNFQTQNVAWQGTCRAPPLCTFWPDPNWPYSNEARRWFPTRRWSVHETARSSPCWWTQCIPWTWTLPGASQQILSRGNVAAWSFRGQSTVSCPTGKARTDDHPSPIHPGYRLVPCDRFLQAVWSAVSTAGKPRTPQAHCLTRSALSFSTGSRGKRRNWARARNHSRCASCYRKHHTGKVLARPQIHSIHQE